MGWVDLEDEMSDIIDDEFAQPVTVVPMAQAGVNARRAADPDRDPFDTVGVLEWTYSEVRLLKGQDASKAVPAAFHSARNPYLSFEIRNFPVRDDKRFEIKQGDACVTIVRGREVEFEVADVQPDGQGRVVCRLNQKGLAHQ